MPLPRFLLIFSVLLMLVGCETASKVETTRLIPPATPGGRMCLDQCHQADDFCQQECSLAYRGCFGSAQMQAVKDYEQYTREQFASHQAIEFRPSDFEQTAACNEQHGTCLKDCESHYHSCYKDCGGDVVTTTSCQFLCF